MKVKELKELLNSYDDDLEIYVPYTEDVEQSMTSTIVPEPITDDCEENNCEGPLLGIILCGRETH